MQRRRLRSRSSLLAKNSEHREVSIKGEGIPGRGDPFFAGKTTDGTDCFAFHNLTGQRASTILGLYGKTQDVVVKYFYIFYIV